MNNDPEKCWGVITGDFVGFSSLDQTVRRRMPQVIVDAAREMNTAFGTVVYGRPDLFRGDEWQAVITDPGLNLRVALYFRASVISQGETAKVDIRQAIGIGPVDYIPPDNVAAGDGPAYRASGKLLGKMGSVHQGRLRCAFATGSAEMRMPDPDLVDALFRLAGSIGNRWRPRQARAVIGALKGWSQEKIAEKWDHPISRQAIGSHLQKAGWDDLSAALVVFERKMRHFVSI